MGLLKDNLLFQFTVAIGVLTALTGAGILAVLYPTALAGVDKTEVPASVADAPAVSPPAPQVVEDVEDVTALATVTEAAAAGEPTATPASPSAEGASFVRGSFTRRGQATPEEPTAVAVAAAGSISGPLSEPSGPLPPGTSASDRGVKNALGRGRKPARHGGRPRRPPLGAPKTRRLRTIEDRRRQHRRGVPSTEDFGPSVARGLGPHWRLRGYLRPPPSPSFPEHGSRSVVRKLRSPK